MTNRSLAENKNWKVSVYAIGLVGGALFGALSAYLYTRSAETSAHNKGHRPEISPLTMIGLSVSLINVVRQFVELGSDDKK